MQPSDPSARDSVDLEDLLEEAIDNVVQAKSAAKDAEKRSAENIQLLETVVEKLVRIKRRREDSGILKKDTGT